MAVLRIYNWLKGTVLWGVVLVLLVVVVFLYWQNQRGFSGRWNIYIEDALEQVGLKTEVGGFRYSIIEGFITNDFRVYCHDDPKAVFADFETLSLDFDARLLSHGELQAERLKLEGGQVWINLENEEKSKILISDIDCVLDLSQGYDLVIEECSAKVGGVLTTVSGELRDALKPRGDEESTLKVPAAIRGILRELSQIKFLENQAPEMALNVVMKENSYNGIEVKAKYQSEAMSYREIELNNVATEVHYKNGVVKVLGLSAADDTGELELSGSYEVRDKRIRYEMRSDTNLPKILRKLSVESYVDNIVSPSPPVVRAKGEIWAEEEGEETKWKVNTHGRVKLDEFRLLGTIFRSMDTEFSWKGGDLYLRDMTVLHEEGVVHGKLLIMEDFIRYEAESNLPLELYKPFVKEGGILEDNIRKTTFTDDSAVVVSMNGTMQRDQIDQWEASGSIAVTDVSYNGVPMEEANCSFVFTPLEAQFTHLNVIFDYGAYVPSKYAEHQPSKGGVTARKIAYDSAKQVVEIDNLVGQAWPAPIINLFAPKTGAFVAETAYFTHPPYFTTNGTIGFKGNTKATNLSNVINEPVDLYYTLLGQDLRLSETEGTIRLYRDSVLLQEVTTVTLNGDLSGDIEVKNKNERNPQGGYSGDISFNSISLEEISDTYEFESSTPGRLTGRMSFSGKPNNVSSLLGEGFIGLDQADLFYIPIFGPLSPVLSGLIGNKKSTHEQVRSVSAGFLINEGVVYTNDLTSNTTSTRITGDGMIDLAKQEIDITVRTKTQGLLALITLPIKPLEKLLQFRGTGSISDPTWANSPFEATPKYLKDKPEENRAIIVE